MNPILIIDPGHGGKDPGGGSNDLWLEKDKVLEISLYQYARLNQLGVPVALTRNTDVYISPNDRSAMVKNSGATYCISNHINAGGGEGAETIHSIFSNGSLANALMDGLVKAGMPKRRVFFRKGDNNLDHYFMHRQTGSVETVITEYGFADNANDTARIKDHWKEYAESVVQSFCIFIGHEYIPLVEKEQDDNEWKYEGLEYFSQLVDVDGNKFLNMNYWKPKIDEPMPVWAVTLLLKRIHESLNVKG